MKKQVSSESIAEKIREMETQQKEVAERANSDIRALSYSIQVLRDLVDPPPPPEELKEAPDEKPKNA